LETRQNAVKIYKGKLSGLCKSEQGGGLNKGARLQRQISKQPNKHMNRNLRTRANRGFTLVELVVVVTIIGLLAAMAVVGYNNAVNNAKSTKSAALVNTLATAKSLFVADPKTTSALITQFNNGPDAQFALIAPYIRVNGTTPTDEANLLALENFPATGVTITLGTVDDSAIGGKNQDVAPTVTGYP
jgi:prepilin-type N-terminal cleavage/methylation domain-containing protein